MRKFVNLAVLGLGIAGMSIASSAGAVVEAGYPAAHERTGVEAGPVVQGVIGSGIDNRYDLGVGARLGYVLNSGLYLGGTVTHYSGEQSSSELLLGGDVGYELYAAPHWELRPFAMVGAAVQNAGDVPGGNNRTTFAFQPGFLTAYHFGPGFVSAEGRVQVAPTPAAVSLLGGAGLVF